MLGARRSLEKGSEHPLAEAIVTGAQERGVSDRRGGRTSQAVTGKGVTGRVAGRSSRSATRR